MAIINRSLAAVAFAVLALPFTAAFAPVSTRQGSLVTRWAGGPETLEKTEGSTIKSSLGGEYMSKEESEALKKSSDEGEDESANMLKQIKDAGTAGIISYAAWELAFWTLSLPVCLVAYQQTTGHWPDLKNQDDLAKLGAEAFAFVNFARFAVPLRLGLALSTTPWVQANIVDRFFKKDDESKSE